MRFASIGSGSNGNGTLIKGAGACLLVDCGFSLKETRKRLARLELEGEDLTGLLVTHGHRDHISGIGVLARAYDLPVWMTVGTQKECRQANIGPLPEVQLFCSSTAFAIDGLKIEPFPVPHDAREPSQFVFSDDSFRVGLLTDTGSSTKHIERVLSGCDALLLECNHDVDLLMEGDYPLVLKQRVSSRYGHLDNVTAGQILSKIDCSRLQHLVAMHLSQKNNRPELACDALSGAMECEQWWIKVADQDTGLAWCELS
ncbi:MAG: MBL fold metallo-hydrolase [Gammaproteobacteria bacterium]|nr:MBL fold metallo-hydrolase [Gammaproteobacteria bacterium]